MREFLPELSPDGTQCIERASRPQLSQQQRKLLSSEAWDVLDRLWEGQGGPMTFEFYGKELEAWWKARGFSHSGFYRGLKELAVHGLISGEALRNQKSVVGSRLST